MTKKIIICTVETGISPPEILKNILTSCPSLIGELESVNGVNDVLEIVSKNKGKEIFVITGNYIKSTADILSKNADILFDKLMEIDNNIKVVLYSAAPEETKSKFFKKFIKSSYGDYNCEGLKHVLEELEIVKMPEIKITWYQKFLASILR